MNRRAHAPCHLAACGLLIGLAVLTLAGCTELGFGPDGASGSRVREERIAKLEKTSAETQEQVKALVEQQQRDLKDLSQLSTRIAGMVDRATAQLDAVDKNRTEQNKQFDLLVAQTRGIRGGIATAKSETAPECRWLGRRILLVLLRDDLIATDGFVRLYTTLGCPIDYIGPVFACVNPSAQTPPGQTLDSQIDYCWQEVRKRPQ